MFACISLVILASSSVFAKVIYVNEDEIMDRPHYHHHHHDKHHKIHRSDYGTPDFVRYDNNGEPYITCASYAEGKSSTVDCPLSSEASMGIGKNALGCYSVFLPGGTIVSQGCWIHQEETVINQQCGVKNCVDNQSDEGMHFCCCRGHECNRNPVVRKN